MAWLITWNGALLAPPRPRGCFTTPRTRRVTAAIRGLGVAKLCHDADPSREGERLGGKFPTREGGRERGGRERERRGDRRGQREMQRREEREGRERERGNECVCVNERECERERECVCG